jgi:hypothetical protein
MERNRIGVLCGQYSHFAVFAKFVDLFIHHQHLDASGYRMERVVSKIQSPPMVSVVPNRTNSFMDNIFHQPDIRSLISPSGGGRGR